jgi:HAD superfamily hydrolase (TIGR01509 family)
VASRIQPEDEGLQAAQRVTGLQAVLFDMDGLLVDTEPLWFEVETTVMARLGGSWGPADQAQLVGGSLRGTLDYLMDKATRPVPRDVVAGWMLEEMVAGVRRGPVLLRPGAAALLAEVRASGVPYALVTSSERIIMEAVFAATGVRFPVTVCAEDVTRIKPDPEPYLLATKLLSADPPCCVALEDSPNGAASAQAAGCRVVAVPNVVPVPAAPDRVIVESLTEVSVPWLRELVAGAS